MKVKTHKLNLGKLSLPKNLLYQVKLKLASTGFFNSPSSPIYQNTYMLSARFYGNWPNDSGEEL